MAAPGVQDQQLEITVVGCNKLKDTEGSSRQDPYVLLEYGSTKYRTRTCTDGGKDPMFQDIFLFDWSDFFPWGIPWGFPWPRIEVWNMNTITFDDFIGSGEVQLEKVLSEGYDDRSWTLKDKRGRYAGEVRLIMRLVNANNPAKAHGPSAPPYAAAPAPAPAITMPP